MNTPIYTSTANRYIGYNEILYPRNFNPENQKTIVEKLCRLEKGEAGMIFSSGTAAISTVLFSFLKAGDHALFSKEIYGGTAKLIMEEFPKYNIEFDLIRNEEIGRLDSLIRENTKIIYTETPSNPLLSIVDLKAFSAVARKNKILAVVDNTFATPIIQNPISMGFDVVVHSGTKYLGGQPERFGLLPNRAEPEDAGAQGGKTELQCFKISKSFTGKFGNINSLLSWPGELPESHSCC